MRETEILRGLHKARATMRHNGKKFADGMIPGMAPSAIPANPYKEFATTTMPTMNTHAASTQSALPPMGFADGMVPVAKPISPYSLKGMYNNAVAGTSNLMEKALAPAPKPQAVAPVAPAPQPAASAPQGGMPTLQGAVGAIQARHDAMKNLSAGTAYVHGPGTGTSDSIHGVSLSKGEAVLPAKTVQAVGVGNLARLIQDTNDGIPPKGLRSGGKYSSGAVIGGVQVPSADDLDLKRVQPAAPAAPAAQPQAPALKPTVEMSPSASNTFSSSSEGVQTRQMFNQARAEAAGIGSKYVPPTTAPAAPAAPAPAAPTVAPEPAAPQGLKAKLNNYATQAKNFVTGPAPTTPPVAKAGLASRALSGATGLAGKAAAFVAPVTGAYQAATDSDANVKSLADSVYGDSGTEDTRRIGANTLNFLRKTGEVATGAGIPGFPEGGLAGGAGRVVQRYFNDESLFGDSKPATAATAPAPVKPAPAAPAAAPAATAVPAEGRLVAGGAAQRIDVPGKSPLYTNLTGAAGAADNAALMGRGQVSEQNMAAADNLEARGVAQRGAEQRLAASNAPDNSPRGLAMAQIQKNLAAGGQLTRAGAAFLQGLDANDTSRAGHQLGLQSAMYGHDVTKYGHDVQRANNQSRLGLDRSRLTHEIGQNAMKGVTEDNENSALVTSVDREGKSYKDVGKVNALNQYMNAIANQTTDASGAPVSLQGLRASNPAKYQQMRSAAEAHLDLGNVFNEYSKDKTFGQATGWAPPNISAVREMSPKDWFNGAGLTDSVLAGAKPGYYSMGVEMDLGGRKQIVPIGKLLASQHGGEHRKTINNWLKANGQPILGNMATGE